MIHQAQRLFSLSGLILTLAAALLIGLSADIAASTDYKLGAGDKIKVTVFGHDTLSGEFEITSSGTISLPLIKSIQASGMTTRQLEDIITDKLKPDYLKNPKVSVSLLNYRPFYILGEVNNPGSYPYSADMTVIKAITRAGGYTYRAKKNQASITRTDAQGTSNIDAKDRTQVLPGDVINIPERLF